MVAYNPKNWWGLIFKFHKSDTFRFLLPAMISVGVFCLLVAYLEIELLNGKYKGSAVMHSLLGFVISMLLVFRTNTAYDRWWEGRRLWGSLVNSSRNLSIKLSAYLPAGDPRRALFAGQIGMFATALKEHLRNRKIAALPSDVHQPNLVAKELFSSLNEMMKRGEITGEQLIVVNQELNNFADVCGACERIKKTPIPYSYSLFIKKFIFIYILSMPFGFVMEFGYWTALITMFVFYVLASIEVIAEEIEDPFGEDANDLPTDDIAEAIGASARELLTSGTPAAA